jgi:hypothetical protein
MTRDDIIRMAREACDTDKVDAWHNGFWTLTQDEIERFFHMAQAAEREACAKVCERRGMVKGGEVFAARIRARGQA